jgi:FlaA1/EpsC-like NDP-sugar epimerase
MTRSNRKAISDIIRVVDVALLFSSLGIAYILESHRNALDLLNSLETHHPIQVFLATFFLALSWQATLSANGFYRSHRLQGYSKEALDVGFASLVCGSFVYVWLWLISTPSRHNVMEFGATTIFFVILSFAVLMSTRLSGRTMMHVLRSRSRNLRNVLIVGTNLRSDRFARDISQHPEWGYRVQGFIDEQRWDERTSDHGPLLGSFDDIPEVLRTLSVDEVIITLPIASFYQQMADIVKTCRHHGIAVHSIGTFFDQEESKRITFLTDRSESITLHDESWDAGASMVKRAADVVISASLLILFVPVLLMVALLIKLTSQGPVFFMQTRLG